MAELSLSSQDQLCCPVCLDLLKDPVTIPCGHSYCMSCIKGYWDQDDQRGVYSCPQCRQIFTARPVLNKNTMLAELAETIKKSGLQAAPPAVGYAVRGDVECDICTERKTKAVKSCLVCLASFCETHLQPHYESPALKKHKLAETPTHLKDRICSQHDKLMEIYCRTDQKMICYLCTTDEHKGHDTVSAAAEQTEKQRQLGETRNKTQQRIQERERELQKLKQAVKSLRISAQTAVEDSERIFTEMIESIERKLSEVIDQIRAKEKDELSVAEDHIKKLEQEISELRKRDTELEQLSHTEDDINFLQSFQSLSVHSGYKELPSMIVNPDFSFDDMRKSVSEVMNKLEEFFNEETLNRVSLVPEKWTLLLSEPKTRKGFLQYSFQLTLDINTAHKNLHFSEGNRRVMGAITPRPNPDHPERFDQWWQVLCGESLSGRCYWEVEWNGWVSIAVSYKDISRKGKVNDSGFGLNNQSWRLDCYHSSYTFLHNNNGTKLQAVPGCSRIGVYLDHRAGTLSFYGISDTMTLLHRVQTTFTQPLYAGFSLSIFSSITLQVLDL
ncbi:tripartite motif-containing protein 16-like isoform X3 [Chanos chanos]|uniref:Tripartite motif-containing protein 16-like isoform X3 n=1 Tax=Chanos chanos TaxID=29144 RepID=A0A6J2V109_CHACN|nr:tripartite motif-containing protein 16-like isoform X3 [Chanos chanos]